MIVIPKNEKEVQAIKVISMNIPRCFLDYQKNLEIPRDCGVNIWCPTCKGKINKEG